MVVSTDSVYSFSSDDARADDKGEGGPCREMLEACDSVDAGVLPNDAVLGADKDDRRLASVDDCENNHHIP